MIGLFSLFLGFVKNVSLTFKLCILILFLGFILVFGYKHYSNKINALESQIYASENTIRVFNRVWIKEKEVEKVKTVYKDRIVKVMKEPNKVCLDQIEVDMLNMSSYNDSDLKDLGGLK